MLSEISLSELWYISYRSGYKFISLSEGGRRGPDPEIPGLKTRYPEVPILNKSKSWDHEIGKKNSQIQKGSIPKSRA